MFPLDGEAWKLKGCELGVGSFLVIFEEIATTATGNAGGSVHTEFVEINNYSWWEGLNAVLRIAPSNNFGDEYKKVCWMDGWVGGRRV